MQSRREQLIVEVTHRLHRVCSYLPPDELAVLALRVVDVTVKSDRVGEPRGRRRTRRARATDAATAGLVVPPWHGSGHSRGMALRSFTDPIGACWDVWDVRPPQPAPWTGVERRSDDDRRLLAAPGLHADDDERRVPDRRRALSRALGDGWLAFQSGQDRRRLAPIPPGWEGADAATLARYLLAAAPAPVARLPGRAPR